MIADFEIGTAEERPELLPPKVLDPKFSEFKTSGLEFEVEAKSNSILVEVDYAPAKADDAPESVGAIPGE